ncbi:hypothetical protein FOZ63_014751, partial [Perkinsus olseni]
MPTGPSSPVADKIPAAPLCGFSPAVPTPYLPSCPQCASPSSPASLSTECASCIDNRVRCFEDCDPILQALNAAPFASPTKLGSYCVSSSSPSALCEQCSAPNPASPWTAPPTDQVPAEDGQQFFYLSDSRIYEYLFINASPGTLTVGTSPSTTYPWFMDSTQPDSATIATMRARTAICFR